MKNTFFYLVLFLSLSYVTSCAPPAQPTDPPVQHADPFYNINDDDYPLIHLPLIKPIEADREDGRTPWSVFLPYGMFVSVPNSQEEYMYGIQELEKFAVQNGVIMAYSSYVNKEAVAYIQANYYHWFVLIPDKKIAEGFHTEDEFNQYIQTLGIQEPDWQTPDEAYEQFTQTGCLDWILDCK
ncbi:MAG TPA: hypothetical protein VFD54_01920 [Anaerolineales bacterium]|nr:hypothetical protein [Anaerolineales bacterium]